MILSKFLCEYPITLGVNDRFDADRTSPAQTKTITLTAGRNRDHRQVAAELQTQITAASWTATKPTWTCLVTVAGKVCITCSESWDMNWNTATYGTTLRDDLGFTGSEVVNLVGGVYVLLATNVHLGGLYPSQPVEGDDRPETVGADRWDNDAVQQVGRSGLATTVGGANRPAKRSAQLLLPQADLAQFESWMRRAGAGYSFAYYHDASQVWPGPSSEYQEYKLLLAGDAGASYNPERVDPANTIWHRVKMTMIARVAPTP
jgi:hypothetical protein